MLSDSTERYDRDGKFKTYRTLASLEEYVLVDQDEPRIEVYRRGTDGVWACEIAGLGGRVTVHEREVAVDAVDAVDA